MIKWILWIDERDLDFSQTDRESWGRAGCGTKIGGSLESNVALEDVIQPFATPKACLVISWSERSERSDENPVR